MMKSWESFIKGQAPIVYDSLAEMLSGDFTEGATVVKSMGSSPDIKNILNYSNQHGMHKNKRHS